MPDVFITLEEAAAFESVSYKTLTQRIYRNPQQYKTKSQAREGGGKDQVLISTSSLSAKARKAWRAAQKVEGSEVIIDKRAQEAVPWYLAKRYAVPLAPAPRVINKFSKDIAVYNLFSRIGIDEGTDQKTYLNRYNAAIKFLTLVAEGTVSIGTETEDPASAAAGGFKVKSNSRLFTREKMRGM